MGLASFLGVDENPRGSPAGGRLPRGFDQAGVKINC